MSILSERIDSLCAENGISGYRLCKDIGISPNVLTELRSERRNGLSAKNANKIASYFGVSVGYLLGTEDTKNAPAADTGDEREGYTDMELLAAYRAADERTRSAIRTLLGIPEQSGG